VNKLKFASWSGVRVPILYGTRKPGLFFVSAAMDVANSAGNLPAHALHVGALSQ
jgi:hypothetical protein